MAAARTYVSFLDDAVMRREVGRVLDAYDDARRRRKRIDLSKCDSTKRQLDMALNGWSAQQWEEAERRRLLDKSISAAVGYLHQRLLGSCVGWRNIDAAVDIETKDGLIGIEVKNSVGNMNCSTRKGVYLKLAKLAEERPGAVMYVGAVQTEGKAAVDRPYKPGKAYLDGAQLEGLIERIRVITGEKLYELCTGLPDALAQVDAAIPRVVADLLAERVVKQASL